MHYNDEKFVFQNIPYFVTKLDIKITPPNGVFVGNDKFDMAATLR